MLPQIKSSNDAYLKTHEENITKATEQLDENEMIEVFNHIDWITGLILDI